MKDFLVKSEERAVVALRSIGVDDHIPAILTIIANELQRYAEEMAKEVEGMKLTENCTYEDLGYHTKNCENCEYNSALSAVITLLRDSVGKEI